MHDREHQQDVGQHADVSAETTASVGADVGRFVSGRIPGVAAAAAGGGNAGDHPSASEQAYDHAEKLGAIQGYPMYALLPALEKLPPAVLADDAAASVGGPRLRIAMHAVRAKREGISIENYAHANRDIADLPADQIANIKDYFLAPRAKAAGAGSESAKPAASTAGPVESQAATTMLAAATIDPDVAGLSIDAPLTSGVFLGVSIKAHPMLVARLQATEQHLEKELGLTGAALGKALGVTPGYSIQRKWQGYHHFALAIDINYASNPWIGGQFSAGSGDADAMAAIWRACWLTGRGTAVSSRDSESRMNKKGSTGELWDHLHEADQALEAYLGAAGDLPAIEAWIAANNLARELPPPASGRVSAAKLDKARLRTADAATWQAQIQDDLARTHGAKATESNWWQSGSNTQRSDLGILDLDKRLVLALREVGGLAWGAADFGGETSGDMMHFDCRHDYPKSVFDAAIAEKKSN